MPLVLQVAAHGFSGTDLPGEVPNPWCQPECCQKTAVFAPLSPDKRRRHLRMAKVMYECGRVSHGLDDAGKVLRIPECRRVIFSRMTVDGCKPMTASLTI